VPGIASGVNWSARLPMTISQMKNETPWKTESTWMAEAVKRTGREPK
jgi:hypothetical protein